MFSICEACGVLPSKKLGFDPMLDPEVLTLSDAIDTTVVRTARIWESKELEKIKEKDGKSDAEKYRGTVKREVENWKSEVDQDTVRMLEQMVGA